MPHLLIRGLSVAMILISLTLPARAVNIVLDYTHDDFFTLGSFPSSTIARNTLNQAAADISAAITSSLSAVTNDVWAGNFGGSTASLDWDYSYTNPTTGASVSVNNGAATIPADQIRIFVGARNITTASTLGVGGGGGLGFQIGVGGSLTNRQTAINQAATLSDQAYRRGAGPVLGSFGPSITFNDGSTYDFDVSYGVAYGNLWFDMDQNNDGQRDAVSSLNNYWHWDYSTPVVAGRNDLYSVALHEILHAIGFGSSETWNDLSSGSTWTGSNVIGLQGSGSGLIGGSHIAQSVNSYRVSDGAPQKPVMVPSITTGQRRMLTALDLAFLRDLGYSTISLDPPVLAGDYNGDGMVDAADYTVWRDTFGTTGSGLAADGSGNNVVDQADYNLWRQNFGETQAASLIGGGSVAVPEPTAITLFGIALTLILAAKQAIARSQTVKTA